MINNTPEIILISRLPIRLGQFLKLAEVVSDGSEASARILGGDVKVNGLPEHRRGRKLREGDVVNLGGRSLLIAKEVDDG